MIIIKSNNLLTILNGSEALESLGENANKEFKILKPQETRVLRQMYELISADGCDICHFDGFFASYSIPQIGKEFDLLRFGENYVINIELKSELKKSITENQKKIYNQMHQNSYYLRFLSQTTKIFTYVEKDGFYEYDDSSDSIKKINSSTVADAIKSQQVSPFVDPNLMFVPSNYLVSPFNAPDRFLSEEYFLTSNQQKVKDEIFNELGSQPNKFFCISANAGTGKTLLLYDIAKEYYTLGKKPLIIHCGLLNNGHNRLSQKHSWNIKAIKEIPNSHDQLDLNSSDIILVDESQRIHSKQLDAIVQKATECRLPVIFCYDVKQYLKTGESTNISEYLTNHFPDISFSSKTLSNKIRTNKEMASFIKNLREIGASRDHLNYNCISIEYVNNYWDLKNYINHLEHNKWTAISYTTSSMESDPYDNIAQLSDVNAHKVIGQEFSKVVFVMDNNFKYDDNKLKVRNSYYSAQGMLYQIVTRAVDELKIIVYNNPILYQNLLKIKSMGLVEEEA